MKRVFFTILSVLYLNSISSQEMNLKKCINYAIEHNISLSNTRINTQIANEQHRQAIRNILPAVNSGISGSQDFGRSIDPNTNTYVDKGSIYSTNMYISAQINVFEGFTKKNTIDYKKLQKLISQEDFNQAEMELAFMVMNSFYDVIYYSNLLNIANEQVKLTEMNLQKMQKLISLGLKAESDLLEMKAQAASEVHRQIIAKNNKETAMLTLKKQMNFPMDTTLIIVKTINPILQNTNISSDSIFNIAKDNMPLMKKSAMNVKASRKDLAIRRGRLYPSLSFGSNISSGYANSWKELVDATNSSLGYQTVPFKTQLSKNVSKRIFIQMNIPIFNRWSKMSNIKTAKYNLAKAQNDYENAKLILHQDIAKENQQLKALTEEKNQLEVKAKAMRKTYEVAEKKLEQGIINVLDFYVAKNQLANAETELLRTKLQLVVKEKTIDFYLGKGVIN